MARWDAPKVERSSEAARVDVVDETGAATVVDPQIVRTGLRDGGLQLLTILCGLPGCEHVAVVVEQVERDVRRVAIVDGEDVDFSVTMIDRATRGAAPPGTVLSLLEQGCFDQATPAIGLFDSQADGEDCATALKTIVLSTGTVTGKFRCRATGTSLVIAAPPSDGTSSGAATISCVAGPEGDLSFSSIEVTDGELISGGCHLNTPGQNWKFAPESQIFDFFKIYSIF